MSSAPPKIFQRLVEPDGTANKVWYSWFNGLATAAPAAAAPVDLSGYLPVTTTAQGHGYIRHTGSLAEGAVFFDLVSTYPGQTSITTLGTIATGTWNGTAIAAAYGGTGQTSYTIGDLLYASGLTSLTRLAAGTAAHVLTSNGAGVAPSWQAAAAGAGTVTSVALSLPAIFSVSGSPVTTSGTLTGSLATQSANLVWAGPTTGAAAAPTFRSLVADDLANDLVPYAKIQNVSATDKLLGRSTAGAGDIEEITCTAAARALLDDTTAAAMRATLGITSGGAIGASGQAYSRWDFVDHGVALSTNTGTSFLTNGSVPVVYQNTVATGALIVGEQQHPGICRIGTGSSVSGYSRMFFTPGLMLYLGGGEVWLPVCLRIPTLSTATQRFAVTFGLYNAITGPSRILDLTYSDNANGGLWQLRGIDSVGTTTANAATGPAANTFTQGLGLLINAAASSVSLIDAGVTVATITTNIPSADPLGLALEINKSVGSTERTVDIDIAEYQNTFTTAR